MTNEICSKIFKEAFKELTALRLERSNMPHNVLKASIRSAYYQARRFKFTRLHPVPKTPADFLAAAPTFLGGRHDEVVPNRMAAHPGGAPVPCVPFTAKGHRFGGCTRMDKAGKEWCATRVFPTTGEVADVKECLPAAQRYTVDAECLGYDELKQLPGCSTNPVPFTSKASAKWPAGREDEQSGRADRCLPAEPRSAEVRQTYNGKEFTTRAPARGSVLSLWVRITDVQGGDNLAISQGYGSTRSGPSASAVAEDCRLAAEAEAFDPMSRKTVDGVRLDVNANGQLEYRMREACGREFAMATSSILAPLLMADRNVQGKAYSLARDRRLFGSIGSIGDAFDDIGDAINDGINDGIDAIGDAIKKRSDAYRTRKQWQHVAVVRDDTQQQVRFYIDGIAAGVSNYEFSNTVNGDTKAVYRRKNEVHGLRLYRGTICAAGIRSKLMEPSRPSTAKAALLAKCSKDADCAAGHHCRDGKTVNRSGTVCVEKCYSPDDYANLHANGRCKTWAGTAPGKRCGGDHECASRACIAGRCAANIGQQCDGGNTKCVEIADCIKGRCYEACSHPDDPRNGYKCLDTSGNNHFLDLGKPCTVNSACKTKHCANLKCSKSPEQIFKEVRVVFAR